MLLSRKSLTPRRCLYLALLFCCLVLLAAAHWLWLAHLPIRQLWMPSGIAELLVFLIILVTLVFTQMVDLPKPIYLLLTLGFSLWVMSAGVDVMDEITRQPLWLATWGEDMVRVVGMAITALGFFRLLEHFVRVQGQLEQLAHFDPLTQLGNRRFFQMQAERMQDEGLSLLMLDLDHFKAVNDNLGHSAGDAVLRDLGALLGRSSAPGYPVRLGGEEFAVLLPAMAEDELLHYAEALRLAVAKRLAPQLELTVSIGAATLLPGEGLDGLLSRTDKALYMAKHGGRNQVALAQREEPPLWRQGR